MSTVQEIENAIQQLSEEDFRNFRSWFEQFEAKEWDQKIANDINTGKLDYLKNEALSELDDGTAKKL